jgi:hypothetical protein
MAGNSALSCRTTSAYSFGWDSGRANNGGKSVTQRFCAVRLVFAHDANALPDKGLSVFNLIRFQHYDHTNDGFAVDKWKNPATAGQARDQGGVELRTTSHRFAALVERGRTLERHKRGPLGQPTRFGAD